MDQDQDQDPVTCAQFISAVRCALSFSQDDKPKSQVALRKTLRTEFPIQRRRPETICRNKVEGFRPRLAFYDLNETAFVWQEDNVVYLQSEAPHRREIFLQVLDYVALCCAAASPGNGKVLQLRVTVTNRFEFMPYAVDLFELHQYFSLVPQPPAGIPKQSVFLIQNETNLRYGDVNGDGIEIGLKFPAYGTCGSNGFIDLTITTLDTCVWSLNKVTESADKALNTIDEFTMDVTSPELHRILDWI